jgi:hypothetical protein
MNGKAWVRFHELAGSIPIKVEPMAGAAMFG